MTTFFTYIKIFLLFIIVVFFLYLTSFNQVPNFFKELNYIVKIHN